MTESEWKPNKQRLENVNIPAFTMYEPCVMCQGKGKSAFQGINRPCWACGGKGKLPVSSADGGWQKKGVPL